MNNTDEHTCRKLFCSNSIYSIGDWRRAMLNKKKSLVNQGITNFENHPEYANLSQCKSNINDRFDTEKLCSKLLKKKSNRDSTLDETAESYNSFESVPRKQPKKSKRRATPQPKTKLPRCPKGSRRDKKTKKCRSTSARGSTSPRVRTPSPTRKNSASKLPRCPKGSRRDKKTKNCMRK